jgi:hypothetical protein
MTILIRLTTEFLAYDSAELADAVAGRSLD